MDYNYRSTRQFDKDLAKLQGRNGNLDQKIEAALATIRFEPKQSNNGYKLQNKLKGQRVYKVESNIMMRYAICYECRHVGAKLICPDCGNTPNNTITMLSAGDHKHVLGRG